MLFSETIETKEPLDPIPGPFFSYYEPSQSSYKRNVGVDVGAEWDPLPRAASEFYITG